MQRFNLRKGFFYFAEIVFAFISGNSESAIYQAYLPDNPLAVVEANSRAIITQVAIVLFAIAFNEAATRRGKGRIPAMLFIGALNAAFSLVAFWFIREAALINEHGTFLASAWQHPLIILGTTFNGSTIDPLLVACMPFFQVAMSWVGPLVIQDHQEETPEQQAARQQRELAEMEYKQKRRVLQAKGLRATFKAAIQEETPEQTPDEPITEDEQTPAETLDKPVTKSVGIAKDKFTASMLIEYVKSTYPGADLSQEDAQEQIRILGAKERATNAPGQPYIASKRKAIAWAKKQFSNDKVTPIAARKRA